MQSIQQRAVVIIEDDEDARTLFASVLLQGGYRVGATGNSRQAVDLVGQEQPDLILCDIAMPEMDGYAVVRALQSDPATRRFPVVFLTGRREFSDRVRAFRFGVVDYITKPVTPETLLSRIDSIISGLKERSGILEGDGPILLEEVQRDGRTGVLTLGSAPSSPQVVLREGAVVGDLAMSSVGSRVRFAELDALREDIAVHDAAGLSDQPLPDFNEVPLSLREIVIAEDNAVFRSALAEVFARCGFKVREAEDGMEAVRRVLEKPPSVLLIDVRMPVLDGFEVCRRLRSHALTKHLPIVFLSGFDGLADRAAGLEAGGDEFLSKRGPLRDLLLRVQLLLRRYSRPTTGGETALRGRIELLGAPGVLQVCHLTALSGTLTASAGSRIISMGFDHGRLSSADSEGTQGREAVFEFLTWDDGIFSFVDGTPYAGTTVHESVDVLVLKGCWRIDVRQQGSARGIASA